MRLSGAEGNRTPVRKPIHQGISHHSHYFDIPNDKLQISVSFINLRPFKPFRNEVPQHQNFERLAQAV